MLKPPPLALKFTLFLLSVSRKHILLSEILSKKMQTWYDKINTFSSTALWSLAISRGLRCDRCLNDIGELQSVTQALSACIACATDDIDATGRVLIAPRPFNIDINESPGAPLELTSLSRTPAPKFQGTSCRSSATAAVTYSTRSRCRDVPLSFAAKFYVDLSRTRPSYISRPTWISVTQTRFHPSRFPLRNEAGMYAYNFPNRT